MNQQQNEIGIKFIRLSEVSLLTGLGKSTILAWEAGGKFPEATRLSATMRVWLKQDITNWILEKSRSKSQLREIKNV
ncbi:AlpA family phage regulatory protein [Polynucleobacter sp. MG-Unter2-18]|uniref:helix-turn-helix transcriptional regulator n=1 Tax=Polynucleobacter sp. MG-Unter2-18 TaxID=2081052 RepID=UPI001BFCEFC9|nr:AlpA family phage regulatory protein [Polynucleobacter sp. MG-Unter2-18]QWD95240.1 AlpA family phage regulatory protein [Polynucleobacter sp. MG-Unter2-18]